MKKLLLILLWLPAVLCAADPDVLVRQNTKTLSSKLLLDDFVQKYLAAPFDAEVMLSAILSDKKEYLNIKNGQNFARKNFDELISRDFAAKIKPLLNELERKEYALTPEQLKQKVNRDFNTVYPAARMRAVADEKKELNVQCYPTPPEVATFDSNDLAKLVRNRLLASQAAPVFEENNNYLQNEAVKKIIDTVELQKRRQIDFVRDYKFAESVKTAPEAAAVLQSALEAEIGRWDYPVKYGVLPVAAKEILTRSGRILSERAALLIPLAAKLPDYGKMLSADPAKYMDAAAGKQGLYDLFRQNTVKELSAKLDVPLTSDSFLDQKMRAFFDSEYGKTIDQIRVGAVKDQLAERYPALVSDKYLPPAAAIETYYRDGKALPELAPRGGVVWSDTEAMKNQLYREKLADGVVELKLQMKLVGERYDEVLTEFRDKALPEKQSFLTRLFGLKASMPDLESIKSAYTKSVLNSYRDQSKVFDQLFPMTEAEIDKSSRALLQQLSAVAVEQQKPQTPPVPEPEKQKIIRYYISVESVDGNIVAGFRGQKFICPLDLTKYQTAEPEVVKQVADAVRAAMASDKEKTPEAVRTEIEIRVKSGTVYYSFVADLRQQLNAKDKLGD